MCEAGEHARYIQPCQDPRRAMSRMGSVNKDRCGYADIQMVNHLFQTLQLVLYGISELLIYQLLFLAEVNQSPRTRKGHVF